jgi:hypothetical protein
MEETELFIMTMHENTVQRAYSKLKPRPTQHALDCSQAESTHAPAPQPAGLVREHKPLGGCHHDQCEMKIGS